MESRDVGWKQQLKEIASQGLFIAERAGDSSRRLFADRFGLAQPEHIMAYRGYANERYVWIRGRVLSNTPVPPPTGEESWWHNLKATWQRWESDEVAGANLVLQYGEVIRAVETDEEGYYEARFERHRAVAGPPTVAVTYEDAEVSLRTTHPVSVPKQDAQYLIISDVDDTVIHTGITDLLTAGRLTFLGNAKSRKPLPGVAGLYRALAAGSDGAMLNPVFYVSNSGWNLYDLLDHFLELNDLPTGPLLLRDLGFNDREQSSRYHKLETITRLLERYPSYPAVLIGDSGQHDASLYADVAKSFPGRILGIYIRDVDPGIDSPYDSDVNAVIDSYSGAPVPMIHAEDSRAFAEHMYSIGLLPKDSFEGIAGSAMRDDQRGRVGR